MGPKQVALWFRVLYYSDVIWLLVYGDMFTSKEGPSSGSPALTWSLGLDLKTSNHKPYEEGLGWNTAQSHNTLLTGPLGFWEWKKVKLQCISISSHPYGDKHGGKSWQGQIDGCAAPPFSALSATHVGPFFISLESVCLCVAEDLQHPSQSWLCLNLLSTCILFHSQHLNTNHDTIIFELIHKNYCGTMWAPLEINLACACAVTQAAVIPLWASFSHCSRLTEALTTLTHHNKTFKSLLIS